MIFEVGVGSLIYHREPCYVDKCIPAWGLVAAIQAELQPLIRRTGQPALTISPFDPDYPTLLR